MKISVVFEQTECFCLVHLVNRPNQFVCNQIFLMAEAYKTKPQSIETLVHGAKADNNYN